MAKVPFEYGTIAEKEYFIDREDDRRNLKTFLGGGINVMLISPRRWGKSSVVKAAMQELLAEDQHVRVCYLDAFKVTSLEDFYNKFASAVIQGTSSAFEKRWQEAVNFVKSIAPAITISSDPMNSIEVNLHYNPIQLNEESILDLPERIAMAKGVHVIVCIDEFQQLAKLGEWKHLEGTMRSVWQQQQHTNYCLYGSKRHMMMDIFGNANNPFYRFGQLLRLEKIGKPYWLPFITNNFANYGKHISEEMAGRVCDTVDCNPWYVQQFCFIIWTHTETEVNEEVFNASLKMLLDSNTDMYLSDIDKLSVSQVSLLKAIVNGESHLNAQSAVAKYSLGSPQNITKNKRALVEKDIVEKQGNNFMVIDPVFKLWLKREYGL